MTGVRILYADSLMRGMIFLLPGRRVLPVLRGERRARRQKRESDRNPHVPLSGGPMTVTVCIMPPCMW
ncbi:MAG: hypothetical protein OHK0018_05240 [Erythrobacter tepidarius]